jgi:hypothetical protein
VRNAVLRGDLRARIGSRKILLIEAFLLGILGLLTFLGLPPELNQVDPAHQASLGVALLIVESVLITYFASACALQEIGIEGEKPAVDLVFGPFRPRAVVAGKSAASLVTIAYWLLLGAPLLVLAAGIRQEPPGGLAVATALIACEAWGISRIAMLYSVVIDTDFSRTAAHWGTLLLIFVGTLALPERAQWINPVVAVTRSVGGASPIPAGMAYVALGVACDWLAHLSLRRFASA